MSFINVLKEDPIVLEETAISTARAAIYQAMKKAGMTQADLAGALGKSPSYVSRLLSGRDFTLRTLASALGACGERLLLTSEPLGDKRKAKIRDFISCKMYRTYSLTDNSWHRSVFYDLKAQVERIIGADDCLFSPGISSRGDIHCLVLAVFKQVSRAKLKEVDEAVSDFLDHLDGKL